MTKTKLEAYCIKCRAKQEIQDPQPVFTATGRPATKGKCPVCGTALFRIGETPAHAGLPRPETSSNKDSKAREKAKRKKAQPTPRDGKLVIVESPAKARTVGRFLGRDYRVKASVGHVRDLLRSQLSVDVENNFQPRYRVPNEKRQIVKELTAEVARAAEVYLATDPDREGEAIAWHLMEATGLEPERAKRVVFHEITKPAIEEAFAQPRPLDMDLVNAQQARRILDRLVGYKISPLLWERVRSRTSAGRVQSVALRLIVEREREIKAFVPEEYWSLAAELAKRTPQRPRFIAKLHRIRGKDFDLKTEAEVNAIVANLEGAIYEVATVRRGERRRKPVPPYTTSTMQQEASRRLGFTARRTMIVAQQLYEGIDLGAEGNVGLITYMRTDSVNVSAQAQEEARSFIKQQYGPQYLPPSPPKYKTRAKGAQEAHEAIRPTSVFRTPQAIRPFLSKDQYALYNLIWRRFVASQMVPAILDTVSVDILAGPEQGERPYLFRATGSRIKFRGFLVVYEESKDEDAAMSENGKWLPPLEKGELLDLVRLIPEQHFTQPPPRFTEATLVRALEEHGIGRPSTYAPILSTIQSRGYVEKEQRRLRPTDLGFVVCDLLVKHFPDVFEVGFTARMEESLDRIAVGKADWVQVLRDFYEPFSRMVAAAEQNMEHVHLENQETGEICELCGSPMVIKYGRYGKFIACSNYPACKNTKPFLVKIGVQCPECGGELVERRTRKGRFFYGCSNYPECKFSTWDRPVPTPCPVCGGLLVQKGKRKLQCLKCGAVFDEQELADQAEGQAESELVPT
ncbi:MAG TPA: type I DNA topoisomerase [Anaerolineae bacterium]|nr:type I DNA topoisomerase [Anaerolineae bacterium]HIQ06043.1 type I DNA topoisomerase [Anaerolineae bacterium]